MNAEFPLNCILLINSHYSTVLVVNDWKRRTDNLGRRKKTYLKKVYELGKYYDVDVALINIKAASFIPYSQEHASSRYRKSASKL